jgi:hypothetical protein
MINNYPKINQIKEKGKKPRKRVKQVITRNLKYLHHIIMKSIIAIANGDYSKI